MRLIPAQFPIASATLDSPPIDLRYWLNTNELLAGLDLKRHSLVIEKTRCQHPDRFDRAKKVAPSGDLLEQQSSAAGNKGFALAFSLFTFTLPSLAS